MDILELKKLIFSSKDVELMRFLKKNLNEKDHSNSIGNLKLIDDMEENDRRFWIARLESIYEKASLAKVAATCNTLIITLIILLITIILNVKIEFDEIIPGLSVDKVAVIIMIFIIFILIIVTYKFFNTEIYEKADAKYYLSLFKRDYKK
ncbi:hypothetical protein FH508_0013195 [Lysinibacillus sp. CD3-6]|uniref:hypothetical protein n=1 Tax=Lysinibacillus sp. CD3-6 TaxID=2892541 RepID=UPI0011759133|nr:hypothetical protein [Lysinibacillus sp. CD3-6]UED78422.1 hypothetical protein FH508_0013195 [Lysinibacillus sp. CD3-6]